MSFDKEQWTYETRWAKKIKAIQMLGGSCKLCGEKDILLLDFHHIYGKDDILAKLLYKRWTRVEKEIQKCELLCANCHSELHCKTLDRHNELKREFLDAIQRTRCEKCGYKGKNLSSLDFHHYRSDKQFIISDALNRNVSVSLQDLYNEVSKCKILCRNCHRIEHFDLEKFEKSKESILSKKTREISKPIDKDMVINMIKNGIKQSEIARKLGCARSTICGIVKNNK